MKHEHDRRWAVSKDDRVEPADIERRAERIAGGIDRQERLIDESVREIERAIAELLNPLPTRPKSQEQAARPVALPEAEVEPASQEAVARLRFSPVQPSNEPPIEPPTRPAPQPELRAVPPAPEAPGEPAPAKPESGAEPATAEMKTAHPAPSSLVIEGDRDPIPARERTPEAGGPGGNDGGGKGNGGGGGGSNSGQFHRRVAPVNFIQSLRKGLMVVRRNLLIVLAFTVANNILVLAIPVYLFQISDRVLTSRSIDTLVMLTIVVVGAVLLQVMLDAIRRFILMRTAVEVEVQLGAPILSAAARASLHGNGREYHVLGDLQQLRSFLTSGILLSFLDAPVAPIFMLAVFLVHPHLGFIVVVAALALMFIAVINQRATAQPFGEASAHMSRANLHLDSMSRNSQIINALAMIPEAVRIWGRDTALSLKAQVAGQDRNIVFAGISKGTRLLTQVSMLGWGAYLSLEGQLTGGMVIAASIIAGRALAPIEGAIEGWNQFVHMRGAYARIAGLLHSSPLNFQRLNLPRPEGRLDVERILFVPPPNKKVILNGISFTLMPGESMAIIGSSGAGKTTLGKMLVGSILPTSGNVRLDLMDLRNWDQRQFGESIGYLPQDVQLFPGTIKANIARMREDATDDAIYAAAKLADVHELIATFPQGYETFVASDGSPLSGGQKQRIALARAFFGNPKMVVLDEPNSNLDGAGEAALAQAMTHAKKEKITVVAITQRPSLLKCVDKILVLNNGTVTMFGTRQDVLRALSDMNQGAPGDLPAKTTE